MTHYDMPSQAHIQSITLRMASQNFATQSPFTFQTQVLNHPGRRWEADVSLRPMRHADARLWLSWLAKLDGQLNTFTMGDPLGCAPQGEAGGTPRVNGGSQTGSSLIIDGATTSQTDWLKAGDYIQIFEDADARLYMVTDDVDTDGSGNATLNIWPPLFEPPTNNRLVITSNTVGAFRLAGNVSTWNVNEAAIYGIQFSAVSLI